MTFVHAQDDSYYRSIVSMFVAPDFCGKTLADCPAGISEDMKQQINLMISEGKTEEEIKEHFVSIYGYKVLAEPPKKGFFLTAWLMPILGMALGGFAIYKVFDQKNRKKVNNTHHKYKEKTAFSINQEDEKKLKEEMKKHL